MTSASFTDAKTPIEPSRPEEIGRYALFDVIAAGGMATVHYGRLLGPVGFSRTVAIKRLHKDLSRDPEFVAMFLDEARLAARIRHPNVVPTLDVVAERGELFVVMEYVHGESLAALSKRLAQEELRVPPEIVAGILSGALQGLHAAHEACGENGVRLGIVHRDVSPQNILVGADGTARVLDFGIAKATGRLQTTREGQLKGKLFYIAPEQARGEGGITRAADIYSAGVVLWETLTGRRLWEGDTEVAILSNMLMNDAPAPSSIDGDLEPFDAVTLKALSKKSADRFRTAREMALAVEKCIGAATPAEVADWLETTAAATLRDRASALARIEAETTPARAAQVTAVLERSPPTDAGRDGVPPAGDPAAAEISHEDLPMHRRRWGAIALVGVVVALLASVAWVMADRTAGSSRPTPTAAPVEASATPRPASSVSSGEPAPAATPPTASSAVGGSPQTAPTAAASPSPAQVPNAPPRITPRPTSQPAKPKGKFDLGGRR